MKATDQTEKPQYAWYLRHDDDGSIYFTQEKKCRKEVIICGPGDRPPSPAEIAQAMKDHPDAEPTASGWILTHEDQKDSRESPCDLPEGVYSYQRQSYDHPDQLFPVQLRRDRYYRCPALYDRVSIDVRSFLASEGIYRELGFQYRRGILLYGPPGNGKSSLIREILLSEKIPNSVVIFLDRIPTKKFLLAIQATLQDRLKIIVFEELATTIKKSNLDTILNFLDGEDSLDRCLILATTNYPSSLPGNAVYFKKLSRRSQ